MQKIGVIILSCFAAVWFICGLSGCGDVPAFLLALPLIISGGLIAMAMRRAAPHDADQSRRGAVAGWSSLGEGIAILLALGVLHRAGLERFDICAIAAVVGLHFLPFGYFLRGTIYYVLAATFVLVAGASIAVPDSMRLPFAGFICAAVLWAACVSTLSRRAHSVAV
jgi:hypothetical protein